jgi:polar amino acid transport system substrate-binding protein
MRQKKIVLVFLLVLLSLATLASAQTGSALRRIIKAGELRVGTSGTQAPFSIKDKNGVLMGYEIDLARNLADAMGVKVVFIEIPFPDLMSALKKGDVDIVMSGMTITPDRNLDSVFIGPYIVSGKSILTKASRAGDLDEIYKLNQPTVTVAVLNNSTSMRFVERFMPRAKHVKVADHEAAVWMILDREVDLMVADFPACAIGLQRHPEVNLVLVDEPLTIEPIGVAMPADNFQLHNFVENYLTALQMAGILDELEAQWFNNGDWLDRLP